MPEPTFYINENGFVDDAGFRDPQFDVELARTKAAAKPVATLPPLAEAPEAALMDDDGAEGQLTIDVYQTPTDIVIEAPIAGVEPENLDVQVSQDAVAIRGERRRGSENRGKDYLYQECYWGKFSRSIILPQEIDAENAIASFDNGVLRIQCPKLVRKTSKKLKVRFN
jgi:HSP20 family protein